MKKKTFKGIQAGLMILLLGSCSKNGSGLYGNNNTSSSSNMVSIANMSFVASSTTVSNGTTVTWTNKDDMTHTVTADDNSFTSGNLNKGDTFTHTFTSTGTVGYHCKIHPGMTATVVVK